MKPCIFLVICTIISASALEGGLPVQAGEATLDPNTPLAIEEAIQISLDENPDITMASYLVKKASADFEKTRAFFMPAVSVYSEFSAGDAPSAYLFKTIDQRDLPQSVDFNDPGSFSNLETGITMGWNIYRGGQDALAREMAATDIDEKRAMLAATKDQIVLSVIKLYFSVLKAENYVSIAKESKNTINEQLRIMEVRFKGGGVLKSDILSLMARAAEAEKVLVQSENLYATTLASLTNLMGREPVDTIRLVKGCTCPVRFPKDYTTGCQTALDKRPEIQLARERIKKAETAFQMAHGEYLPRVDVQSTYYMDTDNTEFNADDANYTIGIRAQWDIFTGFSTAAKRSAAQHQLNRAVSGLKKTRLAVMRDVKTAFLNLTEAEKRYRAAETATAQAEESFELAKIRYMGGSVPITRYLETELAKNQADINLASARFDKKIAKGEIARALGILSSIWEQE